MTKQANLTKDDNISHEFFDYIIQLLTENRAMIPYLKDMALPAKLNGCAHLQKNRPKKFQVTVAQYIHYCEASSAQ